MKYSLGFRLWHWLNALIVLALLATVFLRSTFLNVKTNSEILMAKLSGMGMEITEAQAKILAKAIRAGMWEWHIILGYGLAFLVLFRIVLYFRDKSKKEDFTSLSLHKKGVKFLYYVFYGALLFMSISGLLMHFHQELGLTNDFSDILKEMHEFVYTVILIFVPLHIAGVVIADNRDEQGLISSMLNGKN
jgi:cytochrome b561